MKNENFKLIFVYFGRIILSVAILTGLSFLFFYKADHLDQFFVHQKYVAADVKFIKSGQKGNHSKDIQIIDGRLGQAQYQGMLFKGISFENAKMQANVFMMCRFDHDKFNFSQIDSSQFQGILFSNSNFYGGKLLSAQFQGCRFYDDTFKGINVKAAVFDHCEFKNTMFEPDSLPDIDYLSTAEGLDRLYYSYNPAPLFNLKKAFENKGFVLASLKVNTSIKRSENRENNAFTRALNYVFST